MKFSPKIMAEKFIVNSLLCFVTSAKKDYPYESIFDIVHSFYSHDVIKKAKETLCNLLNEDVSWRRDPEKVQKDLRDVLDFHERFMKDNMNVHFVTDSHKMMPPVGMEVLAPILQILVAETNKINEMLPKILDIKSEVVNTADTVREMKIEMTDLRKKFSSAICGMEEVTRDITLNEADILDFTSLRKTSSDEPRPGMSSERQGVAIGTTNRTYAEAVCTNQEDGVRDAVVGRCERGDPWMNREEGVHGWRENEETGSEVLMDIQQGNEGARTRRGGESEGLKHLQRGVGGGVGVRRGGAGVAVCSSPAPCVSDPRTGAITKGMSLILPSQRLKSPNENPWTTVQRKGDRRRGTNRISGVRGSRKCDGTTFKAAKRFVDVYIGRVDLEVKAEDIQEHIRSVCGVKSSVSEINIRSDEHRAYKVNVNILDRDKLFDSELWPENIIVDKFYNRSKSIMRNTDAV